MEVSLEKIKAMERLMRRLKTKKFDVDDKEQLSTLSAHFLFTAKAMDYTDGYHLVN